MTSQHISHYQPKGRSTITTRRTTNKARILRITAPFGPTAVIPCPRETEAFANAFWDIGDYETAVVADGVEGVASILEVGRGWDGGRWHIFRCRFGSDYVVEGSWDWLIRVWRWRWCLLHCRLSSLEVVERCEWGERSDGKSLY